MEAQATSGPTLGQSPFFYYDPESATDHRQHGHFTPQPKSMQEGASLQQYQQQWINHQSMLYGQPPMPFATLPSSKNIMTTPRPLQQKPAFLYRHDGQPLSVDTDSLPSDLATYPSTPALSMCGSTAGSPQSTCGMLATPITDTYTGLEAMEGVKEGCHGDVKTEILAGGEFSRCDSPPLTPVFIHPPVAANSHSDLLSVNSCPSLSPSPSPVSAATSSASRCIVLNTDSKANFCDPRNLLVDSPIAASQLSAPEFPLLPTLCSGDDEEHKFMLGCDLTSIREELHLTKGGVDASVTVTQTLPNFESFSDLDSENEFVTDLTRFSSVDHVQYLGDKRQRLELISFDEDEFLSEDSFDDLEDGEQTVSSSSVSSLESQQLEDAEEGEQVVQMKLTKKRSPKKVVKKQEEEDFDAQSLISDESDAANTSVKGESAAQTGSTDSSSDGNTAPSSAAATPNTPSGQASARRGRKQSLTDDPSKTFVCDICSRRFRRQEHLKRHHRSLHTHDKPFECTDCGKKFSRSDNLAQHARTHGAGAIIMGVYEEGELPNEGASLNGADTGALGAALFEAAKAAAGSSGSSLGSSTISDRDSTSPTPSLDSDKGGKKRKRDE